MPPCLPGAHRWLLLVLALAVLPGAGRAAKEAPPAATPGPPPAEIVALIDGDVTKQWSALGVMRQDPVAARVAMLDALLREEPLPARWRLMHRLIEFGHAEDVPILLKIRSEALNPWERRIAEGASRALYRSGASGEPLDGLVQEFSFIQTRRPESVAEGEPGTWQLSRWSLQEYHRGGLPPDVIRAVQSLRGKAYTTRVLLAEALQKRVTAKDWKALEPRLLAPLETVSAGARIEGLARVRLFNPLQRPLLLRVGLDAWYGRLLEPPDAAWVWLAPGETQTVDLPVRPQGALDRPPIRLDLRLSEINGPAIPGFHKLYLPLLP